MSKHCLQTRGGASSEETKIDKGGASAPRRQRVFVSSTLSREGDFLKIFKCLCRFENESERCPEVLHMIFDSVVGVIRNAFLACSALVILKIFACSAETHVIV